MVDLCGLNVVDRPYSWHSTTPSQIGTPSPRELPTSCSPSALSARHLENSTTAKPASSAYFAISCYTLLYLAILCYILLYLEQRWLTCKQTLLSPQQVKHLPRLSAAKMCSKNSMRASSTGLVPRGRLMRIAGVRGTGKTVLLDECSRLAQSVAGRS